MDQISGYLDSMILTKSMDPLTNMSINKSPFGSALHLTNIGSWKAGSPTSNPRVANSSISAILHYFVAFVTWKHEADFCKMPKTNGLANHKPKSLSRNFTVTGMSMSCLDRARTAKFGYRKFTAKNHSNPSLIHNSNIHPDDVRAGWWLPTQ